MERKKSKALEYVLEHIDPCVRKRVALEMDCLGDWNSWREDILEQAKHDRISGENDDNLLNFARHFYIKGIDDAFRKLEHDESSSN